ncbi:SIR2 family NAD-dependent protein deacylase [Candidatus Viridilinea mediisalina]|uniref:NAD-dependent protein deacylase n=1 Tax=Candidatus Viridilinea mediisalina TaxID=2024553 RepID=A0A2A6RE28_9CHLR|nr:NAD-dependent deacylase [Candidatus Viridilinea mediisalina]PDW00390.1 NAD-dependent protein deacylase [Candidatus Viridilinea mediisalina]
MSASLPTGLITALQSARNVAVLTGAGVSAESGIPTFRDAQSGLWAKYSPEELASPAAFRRNPRLVWEWYAMRRAAVLAAQPNPGHVALAQLEQLVPHFTLITQNVDGLHARAGSRALIELHGNITKVRCSVEGTFCSTWAEGEELPPPCPTCGAPLRPHVVWFGEQLPLDALQQAWIAAEECEVFLSIGTSGLVEPAASLPRVAYSHGATVAVLNLDVNTRSEARLFYLHGRSGEVLPQLVERLMEEQQ